MTHSDILKAWYSEVWGQGNTDAIDQYFAPETMAEGLIPDLAKAGYNFISESAQWWYGEPYDATSKYIADYPGPLIAWASIHGLAMLVIQENVALEGRDEASLVKLVDDFGDHLFPAFDAARQKGIVKRD